jgi:SAM-dependent methyltransferase
MPHHDDSPTFDAYAGDYDEALARGVSVTGETKDYFAAGRASRTARACEALGHSVRRVLDYGCGVGSAVPHLRAAFPSLTHLHGLDVSSASLAAAQRSFGSADASDDGVAVTFGLPDSVDQGGFDLVFTNGTFHHIPPADRLAAAESMRRALGSTGVCAFWENNPWNPGTRLVMHRIPFDREAIPLPPPEAVRLLRRAGFRVQSQAFCFFFPNFLRAFRPLESSLERVPLGGQYLVIARA